MNESLTSGGLGRRSRSRQLDLSESARAAEEDGNPIRERVTVRDARGLEAPKESLAGEGRRLERHKGDSASRRRPTCRRTSHLNYLYLPASFEKEAFCELWCAPRDDRLALIGHYLSSHFILGICCYPHPHPPHHRLSLALSYRLELIVLDICDYNCSEESSSSVAMRKKMVWTLLIAAVLLASTNTEVNALKLQERDSDLQRIWDTTVADQMRDPQDELSIFQKKEALEKLEKILGIQGDFKKDGQNDMPPQFMTELYNTIADPKGETRGKNPYNANIVRSFSEKDGSSVQYFIFNISGLEQSESVLEAELHLYRKRSSPKSMPLSVLSSPYYLIRVYQVLERKSLEEPDLHRLLNVHYVGAYASGWQVFNVKQAVLSWLAGVPNYGLLVSATTIFGDQVSVNFSLRDEFPQDKQPILVLFNDDGSQILSEKTNGENEKYEEEVDKNEFEETAELDDEETEMMNSIIEYDRHRSKRYNKGQFEEPMEMVQENLPEKFLREKKSRPQARNDRSPKVYGFVSRRRSLEQRLTSMDIYERAMLREKLNLRKEENAAAEPVMEKSSTRARRESVSAPSVAAAEPANECRKPQSEPCAKRELYVNFRDIGLSTIIAPEGYAAYQCRGHCESPLSQEQKPTNHATIQGIIHKMNLASSRDVETPCCVPVNLSSISILYHDEERDGVVLKNYADMTVVSCGCR